MPPHASWWRISGKRVAFEALRLRRPTMTTVAGVTAFFTPMIGTRALADFYEGFDNGVGALHHTWNSGNIETGGGQLTLHGDAGAMQQPWGKDAGQGYGYYEVTAKMSADVQGPAALLWPGDDKWPGPEYDIVEVINGHPYGTVHWNNVDETQKHT